jgi:hypothetical protein
MVVEDDEGRVCGSGRPRSVTIMGERNESRIASERGVSCSGRV